MLEWIKNTLLKERSKAVGGWFFMWLPLYWEFGVGFGWSELSYWTVSLSIGPFYVSWEQNPT